MNNLLVICGPTATGKTELATSLAKKFNGELISADSRQVYKGMDIGTGKDKPVNTRIWLYDVVNPDEDFSVADYYELAWIVIRDIWKKGKLPIIVGGTGLYIKAIVDGIDTLGIPADEKLRNDLKNKDMLYLQHKLRQIDSQRFKRMNNSDKQNSRRLVRAIEISLSGKQAKQKINKPDFDLQMIGLTAKREIINNRIDERVDKRVSQGIIKEIKQLLSKGYTWDLPSMSGLGYRQWKGYFEKRETKETVVEKWKIAEHQYAKNQMTWFKKEKRIVWYDISNYGK